MTFSSKRPTWRHNNESALVKMILSDSISSGTQFVIEHAWFLRRRLHKIYFSFLFKLKKKNLKFTYPRPRLDAYLSTTFTSSWHCSNSILFDSIFSWMKWQLNASWQKPPRFPSLLAALLPSGFPRTQREFQWLPDQLVDLKNLKEDIPIYW